MDIFWKSDTAAVPPEKVGRGAGKLAVDKGGGFGDDRDVSLGISYGAADMPVFVIYDDKAPRRVETDGKRATIGRTADNTVIIDDRQASRRHCEVRLTEVGYVLRDLKSRNNTKLNQDVIDRPMPLREGDEIGIGKATIRFFSSMSRADASAAKLPLIRKHVPKNAIGGDVNDTSPAYRLGANSQNDVAGGGEDAGDEDELEMQLAEAPLAVIVEEDYTGPLTVNQIMPLNAEGRPAHAVGKDASEVSEAMLRLKQLLLRAFEVTATDIHIEPKEDRLHLRYRIDGYLHQAGTMTEKTAKPVYSIVKLLCNLDINKRNIMQDGSFAVQLPDRRVDLRVSIAPSTLGDKMVVRLLDKNLAPSGLASLGMDKYILEQVQRRAFSESGMMVACGPTGSGKTTTMYAILQELDSGSKNIMTVEDPVEYKLEDVTQIQVNPKFGVTFSAALTSLLRQDPDVILVGEMRDAETARMAMQSAMTGHLVLSTVHARDSIGSIFRLLDLGIEPFLLGSALTAVLSQRLLRRLCPHCKMKFHPAMKELSRLHLEALGSSSLYSAVGCEECMNIGYKGRNAIFELLTITDQVRDAIVTKPTIQQLRNAAGDWIFQTLREDAVRKLRKGLTSLEEFAAVAAKD